ncbi:MAG: 3-dehydroquinate synthase [Prevotella sp.]|nr:3-dehydroquinate synthase [Staphylococcus sp.]MCM1349729.1 3-dehydroquinate synthase [Prevotella sp.]
MSEFIAKYATRKVNILFESGIINETWACLDPMRRYIVISDAHIVKKYNSILSKIPNLITILSLKPGEPAKSLHVFEKIVEAMLKMKIQRNDVLIAFGGGVIGDITSYIACNYLHGMDYIQIPTTLVAQVDASIGGKTCINFNGKNKVGCIYHPIQTIIDPLLLKTLPQIEMNCGIATIIKYGFLKDSTIIDDLKYASLPFQKELLNSLMERVIKIKLAITQKDEFFTGMQSIFNFGETIGHYIEEETHFKVPYGKALAIGMYYELENHPLQNELLPLLEKYQLHTDINKYKGMIQESKNANFILPDIELHKIGQVKWIQK